MSQNKELLVKLIFLLISLAAVSSLILWLVFNNFQLHYAQLRLQNDLINLRQDPLLKKSLAKEPSEISELEILRTLAENQQLDFLSSKAGENTLEIVLHGQYKKFLDYLRTLETTGEIIQLDLSNNGAALEGRIILKGAVK